MPAPRWLASQNPPPQSGGSFWRSPLSVSVSEYPRVLPAPYALDADSHCRQKRGHPAGRWLFGMLAERVGFPEKPDIPVCMVRWWCPHGSPTQVLLWYGSRSPQYSRRRTPVRPLLSSTPDRPPPRNEPAGEWPCCLIESGRSVWFVRWYIPVLSSYYSFYWESFSRYLCAQKSLKLPNHTAVYDTF